MGALTSTEMAAPVQKDRIALIVRSLALAFGLAVMVLLPAGYFALAYSHLVDHVTTAAQVKAQTVNDLAEANPDMWMYQTYFIEDLLRAHPGPLASDHASVRDAAGQVLVSLGEFPGAPRLVRSYPIFDSGRVIGEVEITQSYRKEVLGTLVAALLGLILGGAAYAAVYFLPLRALRRITAELVRETEARNATAARYRALAESASDAIVTTDGAGTVVGWNAAAARMFGYTEAEIIGQPLTAVMPQRYRAAHLEGIRRIRAGGERHAIGRTVELHGLTKAAGEFPLELALSEWETPEGKWFSGIIRDITERKRAELALARQKDLYGMLSQTNEAIVRITSRGELFAHVCRVAVEHGRFLFAWVGAIEKGERTLRPVARYGDDAGYIDELAVSGDSAGKARQGLAGRILLDGRHVISNDFLDDPATAPWHGAARRAGVRASAKFPVREAGEVIGAINLYAGETGFFTDDLVATLDEIANDISFALDNFARTAASNNAQAALLESEKNYRYLFKANPHPMWVYDLETLRFLEVNDAAIAHYGWSRDEFLAMTIADIRPSEDLPRLKENIARVENGTIDSAGVWTHRRKDGTHIAVEITSHVLDFAGRRAEIVLAHDVTEREIANKALRAAEEQFRVLVEQTITGIYIIQDGSLAYVNPRCAEIFGYGSADEMAGMDPLLLVAEADRAAQAEKLRERLAGGAPDGNSTFAGVRRNGEVIEVGVHGALATYRGRPAVIGLMQDITEKKRAEAQIRRYVEQLKNTYMSTVQVATTLGELRDPYTAGHERRVADIAVAIGAELGLDERRQEGLRVAGYLHDIGKITVPVEILCKPGKLAPIEYELIQNHPLAGYDVLKDLEFPWPVAQITLEHHERMDGSGYPRGLKGESITLDSRIIAVADVVEAMSSHRPYRPGLGIERAIAEIERGRGTAYDASVCDACVRLFREKSYTIPS